jgi:cytoskeletal protein RodZ
MTNSKSSPKPSPKEEKPSGGSNILFAIAVLVVIGGGAYLFLRPSSPSTPATPTVTTTPTTTADQATPAAQTPAAQAQAQQPVPTAPPKPRPPAGAPMPEIDFGEFSPARPADQVRNAHYFAAKYPDVAQYVPCFCGCETRGHTGSDDCFVQSRDAEGRVTSWEPHGVSCQVCIDVANDASRMHASGATVTQIRTAIENKYRPMSASMTPTPMPPTAKQGTK